MSFPPSYHSQRAKSLRALAGEASRAKAVQAATDLFATSGYRGTSIAKVAAQTGLSQSGLLHHFRTKTALLAAVLEQRGAEDGEFLTTGDGEAPLGWDAFDALEALVARNSTRRHLVELFVRLSAEAIEENHPAHQWVQDHYDGMEAWLTDAVRVAQARGEMRADAPVSVLVRTTIAVVDGLQQQWLVRPDRVSMVDEFSAHVAGLRARWGTVGQPDEATGQ